MKLLSATPSPFARKARIALHEKGIPFELVTEVPWNRDATAPRHNPLGKIPVLLLDDGESIYESGFIVEYLELKYPAVPLLPRDADGIIAARRIEVLCDGACDAMVLLFIERQREPGRQSPEWIARQAAKIDAAVDEVARRIDPATPFACGEHFGLADIAVGCLLGYLDLRYPAQPWRRHPHLVALYERLAERDSFQRTVPVAQVLADRVA